MKMQFPLAPPQFADQEQDYASKILYVFLWTMILAATFISSTIAMLLPQYVMRWIGFEAVMLTMCISCAYLNFKGKTRLSSILASVILWLVVSFFALTAGGVHAFATIGYFIVVLISGILLGGKFGLTMALICSTTNLFFVLLEARGLLPTPLIVHTSLTLWLTHSFFMSVIVVIQYLADRTMRSALHKANLELGERKRVEQALRESEQRYRIVAETASDAIISINEESKIIFINSAAEKIFGYSVDEMLNHDLTMLMPEYLRYVHKSSLQRYTETGKKHISWMGVELPGLRKTGREIPLELSFGEYISEGRRIFTGIVRDITERKRTEKEREELLAREQLAKQRIANILESVSDAFVSLDKDWKYTYINKKAGEIFNREPQELIGKHIWTEFPEGINQPFYHNYYKAVETQKFIELEEFYPPYSRWFENRIYPTKDGLSIFFHDITERKQAELELKESERRFREMLENLQLIAVLLDTQGRITYCNDYLLTLTGWQKNEIINSDWFDRFVPATHPDVKSVFLESLTRGDIPVHYENPIMTKTGEHRDIVWSNTLLRDVTGNILGTASIGVDITERKLAEIALRESEGRAKSLSDVAFEGIGFSENGKVLEVNEQLARMLGYKPSELVGKLVLDLVAPQSQEKVVEHIRSGFEGSYDHLALRKDGSIFPVEVRSKTAPFHGRNVRVTIIRDITERKWTEEALKKSEEKFSRAFRSSPDSITISRLQDGSFIDVNEGFEKISGFRREDVIGKSAIALGLWQNADQRSTLLKTLSDRGSVRNMDFDFHIKGGGLRACQVSAEIIHLDGEDCLLATTRDITEQKRNEEALRRAEDLFRAIVQDQTEMIVRWKPDGTRTFVNQAYCRTFGKPYDEFVGTSFFPLIAEPYRERVIQRIRKLTPDKPISADVHESILPNGELCWQEWTDRGLFDEEGKLIELQSVGRDITDRKRSERALTESHEQLRALTARLQSIREEERTTIAREIHDDLGQALTGLKMDLSWTKKHLPLNEAKISQKIDSMVELVNTSIQTVRHIATELRPGVLDSLGRLAAIEFQAQEFRRRTSTSCTVTSNLENLNIDKLQSTVLFRIFQETLTNIIRHANATRVDVSLNQEHDSLVLTIKDNGRGITAEEISNPKSLGLLGIRERARMVNGDVIINGVPGKGTTFIVRVPFIPHPTPSQHFEQ